MRQQAGALAARPRRFWCTAGELQRFHMHRRALGERGRPSSWCRNRLRALLPCVRERAGDNRLLAVRDQLALRFLGRLRHVAVVSFLVVVINSLASELDVLDRNCVPERSVQQVVDFLRRRIILSS